MGRWEGWEGWEVLVRVGWGVGCGVWGDQVSYQSPVVQ